VTSAPSGVPSVSTKNEGYVIESLQRRVLRLRGGKGLKKLSDEEGRRILGVRTSFKTIRSVAMKNGV